jgi:hypothetical protein
MLPLLAVEFTARVGDCEVREESIPLHNPEEFFSFVAPGGGCDAIPSEVDEIRMVFLPPQHRNAANPLADLPVTLQLGIVLFTGPLSEVVQTAEEILDRAGREELSASFLKVIGIGS